MFSWFKHITNLPIAIVVYLLYAFFAILPMDIASYLGGLIGETFGPFLRSHKVMMRNLELIFPNMTKHQRTALAYRVWDNLGRTMGELPHLHKLKGVGSTERIKLSGHENVRRLLSQKKPIIFVGGHLSNWEVGPLAFHNLGIELAVAYRRLNNIWLNPLLKRIRRTSAARQIPKGNAGLKIMSKILQERGKVGLLVDQKMNTGIPVQFFGREAMTAPAAAALAYHYNCAIVPTRVERTGKGMHFRVTFLPPLELPHTGNRKADVAATMATINSILETWIRQRPDQWLWTHRRWPESGKRKKRWEKA